MAGNFIKMKIRNKYNVQDFSLFFNTFFQPIFFLNFSGAH